MVLFVELKQKKAYRWHEKLILLQERHANKLERHLKKVKPGPRGHIHIHAVPVRDESERGDERHHPHHTAHMLISAQRYVQIALDELVDAGVEEAPQLAVCVHEREASRQLATPHAHTVID